MYIDCDSDGDDDHHDDDDGDACQRYLLWASYVDLEYAGGGLSEYQFWDRENNYWDSSTCGLNRNSTNPDRCAKMDCHLPDTHFSLVGYYKV